MKKPTLCTDIAGNQNGSGLCLVALCCMVQWIKYDSLGHNFLLFLQQLLQKDFQVLLSWLLELDSCRNPASNKTCHLTLPHIKASAIVLRFKVSVSDLCQIPSFLKLLFRRPTNSSSTVRVQQGHRKPALTEARQQCRVSVRVQLKCLDSFVLWNQRCMRVVAQPDITLGHLR